MNRINLGIFRENRESAGVDATWMVPAAPVQRLRWGRMEKTTRIYRRTFVQGLLGALAVESTSAAWRQRDLTAAKQVLEDAVLRGQLAGAALHVQQRDQTFSAHVGSCTSADDMFLIASISKPMSVAALLTLFDRGVFRLDDKVIKYLPEFQSDGREDATILDLLTHTSGLPDQLPQNQSLREQQAGLSRFVAGAFETPLLFAPGTKYRYSSMGILLAAEIAQRITQEPFDQFVHRSVFVPLGMQHSALGLGKFAHRDMVRCQVTNAAPESGAGQAAAKEWDWNSLYWRRLGAPWGGAHASAADVARFLGEFLAPRVNLHKKTTREQMIRNHLPKGWTPRGLGFALGAKAASAACSEQTFGHGGSTGTLAWADPSTQTIFVVLTTLPSSAANPHPRALTSDLVARAVA